MKINKNYLIIIGIILIYVTPIIVIAGGDLLTKSDSTLKIDKPEIDALKSVGIETINIEIAPMECDDIDCWCDINQPDLIQTQFRIPRYYCYKYDKDNKCNEYRK